MKNRRELINLINTKRNTEIKNRCMKVLNLYSQFRKNRFVNDSCAVKGIHNIRIKSYWKIWQKIYSKITGLRFLNNILPRLECSLAYKKLLKYDTFYQTLISKSLKFNELKYKQKGISSLRKFVEYDKKLSFAINKTYKKRKTELIRNAYIGWRKGFANIHEKYMLFCVMAIKFKNAVVVFL